MTVLVIDHFLKNLDRNSCSLCEVSLESVGSNSFKAWDPGLGLGHNMGCSFTYEYIEENH